MTSQLSGFYPAEEYQQFICSDADRLSDLLAGADLTVAVPSCPDWTVRDLIDHLGGVFQWVQHRGLGDPDQVRSPFTTTGPAEGQDPVHWLQACVKDLWRVLMATDPMQPCWTPQPGNNVAGFWSRRVSHEIAMHLNDLKGSLDRGYSYDAALAADGVAEVLDVLIPWRRTRGVPPPELPAPLLIECTDQPYSWLLTSGTSDSDHFEVSGPTTTPSQAGTASAVARGPAAGLLFALWRRQTVKAAGLVIEGDAGLAHRFLSAQLTP